MELYSFEAHSLDYNRVFPYTFCSKCGLVFLKNDLTKHAIRLGCNHGIHASWKTLVKACTHDERLG